MLESIIKTLNEPQKEAVLYDDGSVLVLAGAGSGKTRVLTTRIGRLILTGTANPRSILAVTFTNKAAKEMLLRISSMVSHDLRGVWIGTFHSLCHRMLRMHHKDANLPQNFQIMDMQDQLSSVKRLLKTLNVDPEIILPKDVQRFINNAKEQGLRYSEIEDVSDFNRQFIELYEAYDIQCQKEGTVDFGELLLRSLELLQRHDELRKHYQNRFDHILIDEFQDTNSLQYKWICLLSDLDTSVFAVGDDDQSIYAFRGADVSNMAKFEREFKVKKTVRLEQNYRSHGHILDAANELIKNNPSRLGKNLWTDSESGDPIRVCESVDDNNEATWVIEEIHSFLKENVSPSEIAILYRSNAQSRVFEHCLSQNGIKYRVYGGFRFYDRAEIKNALAYLRLLDNSDDDNAFLRIVNFPPRKIGTKTIEILQELAKINSCSLYKAIKFMEEKRSKSLRLFKGIIEDLRIETCNLSLPSLIDLSLKNSGLIEHYSSEREGVDRLENLKELVTAGAGFSFSEKIEDNVPSNVGIGSDQSTSRSQDVTDIIFADELKENLSPLAAFLSNAILDSGESQAEVGEEAVQLMTIHAAKGLEFERVFIVGLEEGLFPHENSLNEFGGLDEERRLMYVAITRAKKNLFLSYTQMRKLYGQYRYNRKSRFLEEIPEENLHWVSQGPKQKVSQNYHSGREENFFISEGGISSKRGELSSNIVDKRFRVGVEVRHPKFGEGIILNVEGIEQDCRIEVRFTNGDIKWLALAIAKLEIN